jgi:type II secretory pathway pseudopilin PulG
MSDGFVDSVRGVSPVFGYALTLSVATMLTGALLVSAGAFVDDQRENTAESELRVIGQQISADIAAADRLSRTDGAEDIRVSRTVPDSVVGSSYTIRVRQNGGPTTPYLELSTTRPNVTVSVGIASKDGHVRSGTAAHGGEVVVVYDDDQEEVVLRGG